MSFRIYPYRTGSKSVRALKNNLNALSIKLKNSRYWPRDKHIVINWGNSNEPDWWLAGGTTYLNDTGAVGDAANKWKSFLRLQAAGVPTPRFTNDIRHAAYWLNEGHVVFARTKLTGHSGEGVVVCLDADELPPAPLYTQAIDNHGEYRVHVFMGDIILYQKKSRRRDEDGEVEMPEGEEAYVRNLASNWVYRTGNLRRLERIENIAINAVSALGLDFGAVDIIMDERGDVYVLEINTAPGLGNTQTLEAWTEAFNNILV